MGEIIMCAGERRRLPNEAVLVVEEIKRHWGPKPGSTAGHEAAHAVIGAKAGARVKEVSRIPNGSALGTTEFSGYNGPGAAAAYALGFDGTGHDLNVIKQMGGSVNAEARAAHRIAANAKEHLDAVGRVIEGEGKVSGSRVHEVIAEVDKGPEFLIKLFFPNGKTWQKKMHSSMHGNSVVMSDSEFPEFGKKIAPAEKTSPFGRKNPANATKNGYIPESELPRVA